MSFIAAMLTCNRKNYFDSPSLDLKWFLKQPEKLPLRSPKMSLLDHCDVYVHDELANWSLSGKGQLISLHYLDFPYMHRCPGHGWVPLLGWAVVCLLNGPSCTSGSSSGLLVFMPIPLHYLYRETVKPAALNVGHIRNLSQTFPV